MLTMATYVNFHIHLSFWQSNFFYLILAAMHSILSNEPGCEGIPALLIEDQLTSEDYMNALCKSCIDKLVISSQNTNKTA